MKNMKNDKQKRRRKILRTKYPGHRLNKNLYDEFRNYDLVDLMKMTEEDPKILEEGWNWVMNEMNEIEEAQPNQKII